MMDIKIEDYLSEEEIKEICKDALYQKIREDMRKLNVNDIIANISYWSEITSTDIQHRYNTYNRLFWKARAKRGNDTGD